jgi:tRNA nucleotidyltransferase (CCA-adding enzyme)
VDLLERLQLAPGAEIVLAAVGDEPGVHVVGGAVRDVLLGRLPHELDVVVEGDAVAVARRAARRLGGRLTVHERFGTATVASDGFAFDLAGARRERYARPGALPDVELGATLREDLARRDFTINAMAVRLDDGALTAWEGAREDLAGGVLRVLHPRSFVDDPTRILRLARYAARLGFEPDAETDALIDPALFKTVTGDRLGRELRMLLEEPHPALQLARHGIGRALLGERFEPVDIDASPLAKLAACCTRIPDLADRLDALGFPARERKLVAAAARGAAKLRETPVEDGDAAVWRAFRRLPAEAAEVVAADPGPAGEAARRWLGDVRHRRLAITGDDLIDAGLTGAAVGEGLERATVAMLEGAAPDRESQLAAALG